MYFVVETLEEAAMLEHARTAVWDAVLVLHGTCQHEAGRLMQAALEPLTVEVITTFDLVALGG